MPVTLEGSCHCRAVKYTVESNTPVPFCEEFEADHELCQCTICRKVGGYMGSVNIMGNTDTFKILKGEDKIKVYEGALEFDENDKPTKGGNSKRSFCSECSSMLWNYHDEYAKWIYPFASSIDKPNPLPSIPQGSKLSVIMRNFCPDHVPLPEGAKGMDNYGDMEGIEVWHKKNGAWVD